MLTTFPGTTIEVHKLSQGSSRNLFEGLFATGGITLSQVCIMTGLEPYLVQNWVKRGFLSPPKKRVYSRVQFARVIIINMLRESLQIDRICGLIHIIGGDPHDVSDDLISDDELYHRYVDMVSDETINVTNERSVIEAAEKAVVDFESPYPDDKKKLVRILQVMLYAHEAAKLRDSAGEILSTLE